MATEQSQTLSIWFIPELLRCRTIIVVNLNLMFVPVFRLRRKSHSLLDDPRISYFNCIQLSSRPGAIAGSVAMSHGMPAVPRSIPAPGTLFEDLVMKIFLREFFLFR